MNRNEKFAKLHNAIKAYRGSYDPKGGKKPGEGRWIRRPQPHRLSNVVTWLERVGFKPDQIAPTIIKIDGFKTTEEFQEWIGGLK